MEEEQKLYSVHMKEFLVGKPSDLNETKNEVDLINKDMEDLEHPCLSKIKCYDSFIGLIEQHREEASKVNQED